MATQVNYILSKPQEFEISSIDDIDKVLKESDIIPEYHEHLRQIDICILMFEELETNRTWGDMFYDWADGERSKVINNDLIKRLKHLKEEISNGIRYYTRLLNKKDQFKKLLYKLPVYKFSLDVKNEGIQSIVIQAGMDAKQACVVADTTNDILIESLVSSIRESQVIRTTAIADGVMVPIYVTAKLHGEKRGFRYQQIKNLNDALEGPEFLGTISSNHVLLKFIIDEIDKCLLDRELNEEDKMAKMGLEKNPISFFEN